MRTCKRCGCDLTEDKILTQKRPNGKVYPKPYCRDCNRVIQKESYFRCKLHGDRREDIRDEFILNGILCY